MTLIIHLRDNTKTALTRHTERFNHSVTYSSSRTMQEYDWHK